MTDQPRSGNAFERDKAGTAARDLVEAAIENLRQRGGVFVDAVRATRMAMALTDPSLPGNPIVFANQSFLDLSGYSMDEVLGQQPFFMNGPGTDPGDVERFRQILDQDQDGVVETVQYAKNGRRFVATVLLSAFKDNAGHTLHHFLSWADVTRRVAAEDKAAELVRTQAALRQSEAHLEAELHDTMLLRDLAVRMVTEDSVQAIYEEILSTAITITEADAGTVQVYDPKTRSLMLLVTQGVSQEMTAHFHRVDASSNTACGIALRTGQRSTVDFDKEPQRTDCRMHLEVGLRSAQATPLLSRNGSPIGMLNTHWCASGHRPTEHQLRFLDLLARQAADLIEHRRADAALRENEERQAYLLALSDALQPIADPVAIQDKAIRVLGEHLQADRTFYATFDEPGYVTIERDNVRNGSSSLVGRYRLADFETIVSHMRSGEAFVCHDVAASEQMRPSERAHYARLSIASVLNMTLVKNGKNVAAIGATNAVPRVWSDMDFALVRETAERTWAAVERARAEAALRESEERQAFLLTLSDALAPLIVPQDVARTATASLCEHLQVNRVYYGEIEGDLLRVEQDYTRDVASIVGEHSLEPFGRNFLAAYKPGDVIVVGDAGQEPLLTDEARAFLRDRQIAAFADVVLFEEDGKASLLAVQNAAPRIWSASDKALIRDVAERVRSAMKRTRAELALRESEERLRQFGEASQDVLWMRNARTLQWTYLTPAFETIYGLSREEVLAGNNYRSWMDLIVPEDRERVTDIIRRVRHAEHMTFDYRIRRPVDGAIRWLRNTDFPILDERGTVVMIGGIGHDLTELRETELRLETLVQGIPQLVWRAMPEGQWTWASPQWVDYTGLSVADSLGWSWLEVLHPDDRARAQEAWEQAAEKGGFQVEYRLRHAEDGEYRWFQTRATPVRDETGTIIEWLGTSTDIHELRELQERQQVLVAELQHRTRNLMGVIRATSYRTGETSTDYPDFQDRFDDRLEALARVQGLLSRLSDTDRVAFDELIRSELKAMHGAAERATLNGPSGIRLRSSMVQTLAMALHELATNAVKYGALGQPDGHLSVTWRMVEPDRRGRPRLFIDWRESGVMMPPVGARPQGGGQGRELIEKALPYQLDAETSFELTPDGVHCTITIPVSESNMAEVAHG